MERIIAIEDSDLGEIPVVGDSIGKDRAGIPSLNLGLPDITRILRGISVTNRVDILTVATTTFAPDNVLE
jgi:hypothetical protein